MVQTSEVISAHPVTHRHRLGKFFPIHPCTNYKALLNKQIFLYSEAYVFLVFQNLIFTLSEIAGVLSVMSVCMHIHTLYCTCMCKKGRSESTQKDLRIYTQGTRQLHMQEEGHGDIELNIVSKRSCWLLLH